MGKVTGDIQASVSQANHPVLEHIDFASSNLVHGDIGTTLPTTLKYVNFASSQKIYGILKDLPAGLEYANFEQARFLTGSFKDMAGGLAPPCTATTGTITVPGGCSVAVPPACKLQELNIRHSQAGNAACRAKANAMSAGAARNAARLKCGAGLAGTTQITGIDGTLEAKNDHVLTKVQCEALIDAKTKTGGAQTTAEGLAQAIKPASYAAMKQCVYTAAGGANGQRNACCKGDATWDVGIFNICPSLRWLDIGKAYIGVAGEKGVSKQDFSVNGNKCVRTLFTSATTACKP